MGRAPRMTSPRSVNHLLNRRMMCLPAFQKDGDHAAFERFLAHGLARSDAPALLALCLMHPRAGLAAVRR